MAPAYTVPPMQHVGQIDFTKQHNASREFVQARGLIRRVIRAAIIGPNPYQCRSFLRISPFLHLSMTEGSTLTKELLLQPGVTD